MGRRSLRKIPDGLDLSHHLLTLADGNLGLAESLFGRQAPWEIEVGTGKGLFLAQAAAANPQHDFLGCEIARKYAAYAAARLARARLPNAKVIQGDAQQLFRDQLQSRSIRAVHVYFPDPWWKKRHQKRRVMNEAFLGEIYRVLEFAGKLHFWTDVREYFERTCALIAATTPFAAPQPVQERPAAHDLDYRTHFERRTRQAEQPVYRAEFIKG
jgi:tRNA (guanine-N7-)-methyltransferase